MVKAGTKWLRLGYESYKVELSESDCARAFGELLQLAEGTVKHFTSDLYHDAMWLHENLPGKHGTEFYYGVRESGTSIGWSRFVAQELSDVSWHVSIRVIDGSTMMDIVPL